MVDDKKNKNIENGLNKTVSDSKETNNKNELIPEPYDKDKENLDFIFSREWLRFKK